MYDPSVNIYLGMTSLSTFGLSGYDILFVFLSAEASSSSVSGFRVTNGPVAKMVFDLQSNLSLTANKLSFSFGLKSFTF